MQLPKPVKASTLALVEKDIAEHNLARARDRLHGLIASYPAEISLRAKLAEIYWELGQPAMAGRYWYLHSERTEEVESAVAAFEKECSCDTDVIVRRLKLRLNPHEALQGYAKDKVLSLLQDRPYLLNFVGPLPPHVVISPEERERLRKRAWIRDRVACLGCALLVLTFGVLFVIMVRSI